MSEEDDTLEAYLIDQELKLLSKPDKVPQRWGEMQSAPSIWSESHPAYSQSQPHSDPNKHRFNHYADKQLTHLVVIEQFDFGKIASLLSTFSTIQTTSFVKKEPGSQKLLAERDGNNCMF